MPEQTTSEIIPRTGASQYVEPKSVLIGVHCSMKLTNAIDAFIADHFNMMKRPEAIRKILVESLAEKGYLQRDPR